MPNGKYFPGNVIVVYLDQCVVSLFLPHAVNKPWKPLCAAIERAVDRGFIICPWSLEHLVETSSLKDPDVHLLQKTLSALSKDWQLRIEPELVGRQIIEQLRGLQVGHTSFLRQGSSPIASSTKELAELRQLKKQADGFNERMMEDVNYVNSLTRSGQRTDSGVLQWMQKEKHRSIIARLVHALGAFLKNGSAILTHNRYDRDLADWESIVVRYMVNAENLTHPEAQQLKRLLLERGLEFSPTLLIKAELDARQFAKQEKVEARDQYDITQAACALPYADIYVTDGGKATAIRELKLDQRFRTKIYSTKPADLNALAYELNAMTGE